MNALFTDDILSEIFSYFSLREVLCLEIVCRKWRQLGLARWHSLKKLSLNELFPTAQRRISNSPSSASLDRVCNLYSVAPFLKTTKLRAVADRCGRSVRELITGYQIPMKMQLSCWKILAADFPRLQYLDLSKIITVLDDDDDDVQDGIDNNVQGFADFEMSHLFGALCCLRIEACFDDSALSYHTFDSVDPLLFKLFSAMPHIESASLGHNTLINGSSLLGLSTAVKSLDLGFCRRASAETLILVFSSLPNLMHISLYSNNRLTGVCLNYLPTCLETADISYCDNLDADSLIHFLKTHRHLKSVQMSHVQGVTNQVLSTIGECLHELESLSFSCYYKSSYYEQYQHPHDITRGLKSISSLKHLKQLDLSKNDFLMDPALIGISYGCVQLEDINLSQLANAGELGFASLGRLCHLKKLDISGNDCIDETVLLSVAHGGNLEFVNARRCSKITEAKLKTLGDLWPNNVTVFQVF